MNLLRHFFAVIVIRVIKGGRHLDTCPLVLCALHHEWL